jgi:radical SAM protein
MMKFPRLNYEKTPFLVIWETTQACALACQHCRAEAIDERDPHELSFAEACKMIGDVAFMGTPIIVFSGGDPLQREDLEGLIYYAKHCGLRVGCIPAATPRLTAERLLSLKKTNLDQVAFSIDGATETDHDSFRGVIGSFNRTLNAAHFSREIGLPLQINTCFGKWNYEQFDAIADLVNSLGVVFWEIFFLVPTGRGSDLMGLSAQQYEVLFEKIYERAKNSNFMIKVTEAPHYRRFVLQHEHQEKITKQDPSVDLGTRNAETSRAISMAQSAVNAGKGFCFVSRTGDVFPSGFLAQSVGNVRHQSIVELYRDSPVMKQLRNPNLLKGRCGQCEYRVLCGGSRSRAFALTGDYLAEDPSCDYQAVSAQKA